MNKTMRIAVIVAGLAISQVANAVPILINGATGVVVNPADNSHLLPALDSAITAWNFANNPDLPARGDIDLTPPIFAGAIVDGSGHATPGSAIQSITIDFSVEPETYLGLTWDGPQGGTQFFYVAGETGTVTFNSPIFATGAKGLSHYIFTGPGTTRVPDGGMTLVLLGSSLTGLAFLARSRKFNGSK